MGKVISSVVVTKPEQLSKVDSGPIQIILRPNLSIRDKNKGTKNEKRRALNIL